HLIIHNQNMRVVHTYTWTNQLYTLSLHDALPICYGLGRTAALTTDLGGWAGEFGRSPQLPALLGATVRWLQARPAVYSATVTREDRKSTRLNSSHVKISYAVFCLKKKNT